MSEHENQFPEELFDLFSKKTFGELTDTERELVLSYTTADEYDQLAESVLSFSVTDRALELSPPGMPSINREKEDAIKWWSYKIPLYQAIAASIALTVACMTMFQLFGKQSIETAINTSDAIILNSTSIDEKAIDRHLAEIKLLVNKGDRNVGTSLANDNYPKDLVFDF